jgi:pyruvate/2-oxoglutarate dehydrogenase complex dihydrolipoamide acyltransferase (E2) component
MERHGLTLEDVRNIQGSGDGGRVTKQDILAYVEPPAAGVPVQPLPAGAGAVPPAEAGGEVAGEEEPVEEIPLSGLRRAIAEHMVRSKHAAPHVTTVAEVDMTTLVEFREQHKARFKEEEGVALTYMAFFVKAVCEGLKVFPGLNASMEGEKLLLRRYYHIGAAVETPAGLVVPVIRHADRLSIRALAKALHRVAEGARARKLAPTELEGGTFTITNPGVFGGVLSTPIIHQPQAAILGVQAIQKRPVVRDDRIAIRSMMYLCLSYDHRIVDGATAVQFLQAVRRHLEDPLEMFV